MAPVFRQVELAEIAICDVTCLITYHPQMEALQRSVAAVGVLTPLHLRYVAHTDKLQIVCGSKRLQACEQLSQALVPALVYSSDELSDEDAFWLVVYDNLGCRDFNAVEKGRVLWRLQHQYQWSINDLLLNVCGLLDIPPRADVVASYCDLVGLDDTLQLATVEGALPLEAARWIGHRGEEEQPELLKLFLGLRIGRNRAREFVTLIEDLCHRDGYDVVSLCGELELHAVLDDTALSGPQKIEQILGRLRQSRFPRFHAHEQVFQAALRQLRLPPQMSVQPPPYFDGHQYQVSFHFGTEHELRDYAQRLLDAASHEAMKTLLGLL